MIAVFNILRKPLRLLILPLIALALAACEPVAMTNMNGSKGPKVDSSKPIPVALLIPRGGSAADNLLAQELENAARLAIRDLGGVQIDLRVYGTGGNAGTAGHRGGSGRHRRGSDHSGAALWRGRKCGG